MIRQDTTSVPNALGFDLEHWHSATLLADEPDHLTDHVDESVSIVLDLLHRTDVRATFFVVGELATEYPELVRRIRDEGHELASHGHTHTPLFELTPDEFETELRRSSDAIRQVTGVAPKGFRAPNFSVTPRTEWAFRILESRGYRYDSSVFPVETPMYGVSGGPIRPYRVPSDGPYWDPPDESFRGVSGDYSEPDEDFPETGLAEFPVSVADSRFRVPIAGGFYARVLPTWVLERAIARLNDRGISANLYFHPWEFNPSVRVETPPLHARLVSFYGIERLEAKLERLLSTFSFGTVRDVLRERGVIEQTAPSRPDRHRT